MDPFLLMQGEQILKNTLAKIDAHVFRVYLTNVRVVVLNNASNLVFNSRLDKMENVNLIKASLFKDGLLKIFHKDGNIFAMTLLHEGRMVENKPEMNDWFNYIHQFIINKGMGV